MSKSIKDIEKELIDEFSIYENRMEKYEYIIELGKELTDLPTSKKNDDALIKGCQSRVWLHATVKEGRLQIEADSDAFIVKGLVSMILRLFSNQLLADVFNYDMAFIKKIGLDEMLSPTRSNGLASMLKQIKIFALALQAKNLS